jgi:glycerophosphoryl diester phosphodiesterase
MCELDVRLTRGGELVVCHDADVDRTTEGHGGVASMSRDELKRLDGGVKFDSRFAGERIPTLAEVLEVTAGRCGLNIELKAAGTEKPVCETVRSHGAIGTTLVSSFEREQLGLIRLLAPEIRVGLLASRRARQLVAAAVEMGAYAITHATTWSTPSYVVPHMNARCRYTHGPRMSRS